MNHRTIGLLAAAGAGVLLIGLAVAALAAWGRDKDPSRIEIVNETAATGSSVTEVVVTIGSTLATTSTAPTTTAATTTTSTTTTTTASTTTTTTTTVPTTPPPPPGRIEVSNAELALGLDKDSGVVTVTNSGGQPVDWTTSSDNALVQAAGQGSLGPGAKASLTISVTRAGLIEGEYTGVVSVVGGGRAVPVTVTWQVERPPVVRISLDPPGLDDAGTCPQKSKALTSVVTAEVIDESATAGVTMAWTGPGQGGSAPLTPSEPGKWSGTLGPLSGAGTWTLTVTATDARGNPGSGTTTLLVTAC
jgi:hypothetical protein